MELERKKKWLLVLGGLGFSCYSAFRFYNSSSVVQKRRNISKLLNALVSMAVAASDSAEAVGILSKDLKEFIRSDSDQIPRSLKQLSKIATSDEFSESLSGTACATTLGILRGYQYHRSTKGDFSDMIMDKLFSKAASGFASVVIGSFARNLVVALYSEWERNKSSLEDLERWVDFACKDKCRHLVGDFICLFVSTAVSVYLDKTMDINTYNEIFSGLTNPNHETKVRNMLVSVSNGAVETFIRTSHNVWTNNSKQGFSREEKCGIRSKSIPKLKENNTQESGWERKMPSALAVLDNMKLILNVTGIITFRSFLKFLLQRVSECVKRSTKVFHQEVVNRGFEAVRYVCGRSSDVTTICITLCLNVLNSPWIMAAPYSASLQ